MPVWSGYRQTSWALALCKWNWHQFWNFCFFLGVFAQRLWKMTTNPHNFMSVHSHWTGWLLLNERFWNFIFGIFLQFVDTLKFWIQLVKVMDFFLQRLLYIYISPLLIYIIENVFSLNYKLKPKKQLIDESWSTLNFPVCDVLIFTI